LLVVCGGRNRRSASAGNASTPAHRIGDDWGHASMRSIMRFCRCIGMLNMAAVSSTEIHRENDRQRDRRATSSEQQDVTDIMTSDALPLRHIGNDSGFLLSSLFKVVA
jgi:hypothetical protein